MKNLRTQEEIMATWKRESERPVVSICCITYNHEPYIEDALEGFLIQETEFPFEIIVHDDASTDNTSDILRDYQKRYPRIIKCILQKENKYSKGIKPSMIVFPLCKGEFIAICEGDDYWTDPNKLAVQEKYLKANPDVVITSHDAKVIDSYGNVIKDSKLPDFHKRDYSGEDLVLGKAWMLTMNWMFRNIEFPVVPERRMVKNGDNFFVSILGLYGGSHFHFDIEKSVYREHDGGVWSSLSDNDKVISKMNTWLWMYIYYRRVGLKRYEEWYWRKFISSAVSMSGIYQILYLKLKSMLPARLKLLLKRFLR